MLIERTPMGITVKRNGAANNHVRIALLGNVYFYVNGERYDRHTDKRPHDAYTVGELGDLLGEMVKMESIRG